MMISASIVAAVIVALIFAVTGIAKVSAVPAMRTVAAHLGFTVAQYRILGVLQLAGVVGVIAGLALPLLGIAAAMGLTLMMLGASVAHIKVGDHLRSVLSPLLVAAFVVVYLVTLA